MISQIKNKVYRYLSSSGALSCNDEFENEWIRYGVELTVSSIIGIAVIMLGAALAKSFWCGIVFLLVFVPLRQLVGGYHADSYICCNLVTISGFAATVAAVKLGIEPPLGIGTSIAAAAFLTVLIYIISPVENRHKPITDERQRKLCRYAGTLAFAAMEAASFALQQQWADVGKAVRYTLLLVALLSFLGKFKYRKEKRL